MEADTPARTRLGRTGVAASWRDRAGRWAGVLAAPILAVSALAVAIWTQFAYTEGWDISRRWLGFLLAALLFAGATYAASRRSRSEAAAEPLTLSRDWEYALLALIAGLAAFYRVFRFEDFPPGLWYDEGVDGIDAIYIIEKEHFTVWRETNYGRPTLYFYLLAASFKLFGYTMFAFRIVPVLAGIAAVVAFYYLARWLVGVVPALVATALLAVSRWAVTWSRISWESSLVPLFAIMSAFFLVRALDTRNRFYFFMAGGSLAAGLYTHPSFRIVPAAMALILAYIAVTDWPRIRRNFGGIVLYAASFAVVVFPLAQYAGTHYDEVTERQRQINVFKQIDEQDTYEPLRFNARASIEMLNIRGDLNARHNLPGEPMLDEITFPLFLLGLAACFWALRDWRRGMLPGWYVLALLPGALTITVENPSAIRAVGAIPPIYLMVGVAAGVLYRTMAPTRAGVAAFVALASVLVAGSATINYYDFFERQAEDKAVYDMFQSEFREVAELTAERADDDAVWTSREFTTHPAVVVLGHEKQYNVYTASTNLVFPSSDRDVLIIADRWQFGVVPTLQRLYPNLRQEDHVDPFGRVLWSRIIIPANDVRAVHELPVTVQRGDAPVAGAPDRLRIDHEWTADDLAQGPLTVTWEGHWWPTARQSQTFVVRAPGTVRLEIDGQPFESLAGDLAAQPEILVYGEHAVRVTARIEQPGRVEFAPQPGLGAGLSGGDSLYGPSVGDRGFRVVFREGDDFATEPVAQSRVPFAVPVDRFGPAGTVEYQGIFVAESAGSYGFALDSGNSAQLLVDDQLVVDNGGSHAPARVESTVDLTAGEHLVSIQYTLSDRPIWSLYLRRPGQEWARADGSEFAVPSGEYRPPAIVRLAPDETWGAAGRRFDAAPDARAVAVAPDGTVVLAARRTLAFVSPDGAVLRTLDVNADDIIDVDVAPGGEIAIADRGRKSVVVLSPDGGEIARYDGLGSSFGVGADADRVYIASPAGGILLSAPLRGGDTLQLPMSLPEAANRAVQPSDVLRADDGSFYAADFEKGTIVRSADGVSNTASRGVQGSGDSVPRLAISGDLLLVSDPINQRVLIVDRATGRQRGAYVFRSGGEHIGSAGIDVGPDNRVYVVDFETGTVYRFLLELPEEAPPSPQ